MTDPVVRKLFEFTKRVVGFHDDVYIYTDGSGKFNKAAVLVVVGTSITPVVVPYATSSSSALAELAAFQVGILIADLFTNTNTKVIIRSDSRGILEAYYKALSGKESSYPICKRLVDFVKEDIDKDSVKRLDIGWVRGHSGDSLNEMVDHLCRFGNLDGVYDVKFKYLDQVILF